MEKASARGWSDRSSRKREDFVASFGALRHFELATEPRALEVTTSLLGRAPTSYRTYVTRVVAGWSARQAPPERRPGPGVGRPGPAGTTCRPS